MQKVGLGGDGPHRSFLCFLPGGKALAKLHVCKDKGKGFSHGIQQPEK